MPEVSQLTPERRSWLRSVGIDNRRIRRYGLKRPMTELAWLTLAHEVVRLHGVKTQAQPKGKVGIRA